MKGPTMNNLTQYMTEATHQNADDPVIQELLRVYDKAREMNSVTERMIVMVLIERATELEESNMMEATRKKYPSLEEAEKLLDDIRNSANVTIRYKDETYWRYELLALTQGWTPPR